MAHKSGLKQAIRACIDGTSSLFEHSFATSAGAIDCLAEVVVSNDCIEFNDVCIYPANSTAAFPRGTAQREIRQELKLLLQSAAELGYAQVKLMGRRVARGSSARPGKVVAFNRKVKP